MIYRIISTSSCCTYSGTIDGGMHLTVDIFNPPPKRHRRRRRKTNNRKGFLYNSVKGEVFIN